MAGTRYLLQGCFAVQLLVVVAVAFYFGLSQDRLVRTIFGSRDDFRKLVDMHVLDNLQNISVPAVTFVCADSQVEFWKAYLKEFQKADDVLQVQTHFDLQLICKDPSHRSISDADVWICESVPPPQEMRMVMSKSSIVVYSRGLRHRKLDIEKIYPNTMPQQRDIEITVHIAAGDKLTEWKNAIAKWIKDTHLSSWPSIGNIHIRFKEFNVSALAKGRSSETTDEKESESPFTYEVNFEALPTVSPTDDSFHISLFVPTLFPTVFVSQKSKKQSAVLVGKHRILAMLSEPSNYDSYVKQIDNTLGASLESLLGQSMGLVFETTSDLELQLQPMDNTFPNWHAKLWYHRALGSQHAAVIANAKTVADELLKAPASIIINREIAERWREAIEMINGSRNKAARGEFGSAMQDNEKAFEILEDLIREPQLVEPTDLPMDQYAAIFAPLLLPLLLPVVTGFVREHKRYHTLTKGNKIL
jgi:hypothetical protein